MSNQLDLILMQKYKNILNFNNLVNTSGNTVFNGNFNINNSLYVYGQSLLNGNVTIMSNLNSINNNKFNNVTILSNLNVSNNTLLNNCTISSNLNTFNLNLNNLQINNNSIFNNNMSINSNLNILNNTIFNNGLQTNNIYSINQNNLNIYSNIINIGSNSSLINIYGTTTFIAATNLELSDKIISLNLNGSGPADIGNLSGIELLGISGNGFITTNIDATRFIIKAPIDPNIYYIATTDVNNNLFVTGKSLFYNNVNLLSNLNAFNSNIKLNSLINNFYLNVSNNTIINNNTTINSNLNVLNNTIINNSSFINSNLNVNRFTNIINNVSLGNNLYVSSYTNILGNATIFSLINLTNNSYLLGKSTILGSLYVSNNTNIIGNVSINSNLVVLGNTNLIGNQSINSFLNVNGSTNINNNISISSNVVISGYTVMNQSVVIGALLNNLNINGPIICPLNEYSSNNAATLNNVPIFGFYRTGGIVKICLDQTIPIVNLSGAATINLIFGSTYTDSGAYTIDRLNNVYFSLMLGSTNILSNILISGTNTLITTTSTLSVGNYTATYTATDSIGLVGTNYRLINIIEIPMGYNCYNGWFGPIFNSNFNNINNSDWTIQGYAYLPISSDGYYSSFITIKSTINNNNLFIGLGGYSSLLLAYNGNWIFFDRNGPYITYNTWNHFVFTRYNNNLYMIINGIWSTAKPVSNYTNFNNLTNLNQLYLGYNPSNSQILPCYLSQINISNTAIYTNIGVSFPPLYNLSSQITPNTIFFLGNNFNDKITNNNITINSSVLKLTPTIPSFISYNCADGYLGPLQQDYSSLNNNSWTIEAWVIINTSNFQSLFDFRTPYGPVEGLQIIIISNQLYFCYETTGVNSTVNIVNNQWTHIACMKINTTVYIYVNGVVSPPIPVPSIINTYPNAYLSISLNTGHGIGGGNFRAYKFTGTVCQPLLTLGAKYSTSGFTPQWDLTPTSYSNVLFWLNNGTDVISKQKITINYTVLQNIITSQPF
jgi:hypothetical protein